MRAQTFSNVSRAAFASQLAAAVHTQSKIPYEYVTGLKFHQQSTGGKTHMTGDKYGTWTGSSFNSRFSRFWRWSEEAEADMNPKDFAQVNNWLEEKKEILIQAGEDQLARNIYGEEHTKRTVQEWKSWKAVLELPIAEDQAQVTQQKTRMINRLNEQDELKLEDLGNRPKGEQDLRYTHNRGQDRMVEIPEEQVAELHTQASIAKLLTQCQTKQKDLEGNIQMTRLQKDMFKQSKKELLGESEKSIYFQTNQGYEYQDQQGYFSSNNSEKQKALIQARKAEFKNMQSNTQLNINPDLTQKLTRTKEQITQSEKNRSEMQMKLLHLGRQIVEGNSAKERHEEIMKDQFLHGRISAAQAKIKDLTTGLSH